MQMFRPFLAMRISRLLKGGRDKQAKMWPLGGGDIIKCWERNGEGNDLYGEMIENSVIKLGENQSESMCALVYEQMNEPSGALARVGLTRLAVAEHFRDVKLKTCFSLLLGQFGGSALLPAGTYSFCCRLPTCLSYGFGRTSGTK